MQAIELQVGESFVINDPNYKQLVFKVESKDDQAQEVHVKLDTSGLPELEHRFPYTIPVVRVFDVPFVEAKKES